MAASKDQSPELGPEDGKETSINDPAPPESESVATAAAQEKVESGTSDKGGDKMTEEKSTLGDGPSNQESLESPSESAQKESLTQESNSDQPRKEQESVPENGPQSDPAEPEAPSTKPADPVQPAEGGPPTEESEPPSMNESLLAAAASVQDIEDPEDDPEFNTLPDQTVIMEKLAQIRDSKRQVVDMLDAMKKEKNKNMDKAMLSKLVNAYDGFKSQEEQYLALLQKIMAIKEAYKKAQVAGENEGEEDEVEIPELDGNPLPDPPALANIDIRKTAAAAPAQPVPGDNPPGAEDDSTEEKPVDHEMLALMKQRDLLRTMLAQQKEIKTRQHDQVAKMEQRENVAKAVLDQKAAAQELVDAEANAIAEKRALLAALKEKLAVAKQVRDKAVEEERAAKVKIGRAHV